MDYASAGQGQQAVNRAANRIDADIQRVQKLTSSVHSSTNRIIEHARKLGYFQPTPEGGGVAKAPTPIQMTLADVLSDLERAVDHLSGNLNAFD